MTMRFGAMFVVALAFPAAAWGVGVSGVEEHDAMRQSEIQYRDAVKRCDKDFAGRQKADCKARAKAERERERASTSSAYGRSEATRETANDDARAQYKAAKARCDALDGSRKDACIEKARTARNDEVARDDDRAGQEKLDANYRVELRGCEDLSKREKDSCVANVRAKYGR